MAQQDGEKPANTEDAVLKAMSELMAEIKRSDVPDSITELAQRLSRLIAEKDCPKK